MNFTNKQQKKMQVKEREREREKKEYMQMIIQKYNSNEGNLKERHITKKEVICFENK